jgi:transglutaminase-like putative cysteine protease
MSNHHWRGLSYDIYTGRGWAVSAERKAVIAANQAIPLPAHEEQNSLEQTISWAFGESTTRYTLGLPTQFDQEVSVFWRGLGDLSRVQGEGANYSARSSVPVATAEQLRQATIAGVPPAILARYTELPDSVPGRVHELAQKVAAVSQVPLSPYDQAKALEQFLRQYPYSTDVELPPAGADPVDFFLFDLQTGYCDYYASAMVIMARSLGLPARLAAGFLAQPADEFGRQTIYQINGHSWAEIYFADYGWVEFEPTAPFPAGEEVLDGPITEPFEGADHRSQYTPPAIPEKRTPQWLTFLVLVPILFFAGLWWLRRRRPGVAKDDGILWAYDRLLHRAQQLGQPTPLSQTPSEFEASLLDRLNALEKQPVIGRLKVSKVYPQIKRLTASFVARRYSEHRPPPEAAVKSWKRIRGRLWFLSILEKVTGFIHADRA